MTIEFQNNGYLERDLIEKIIELVPMFNGDTFRCWSLDFVVRNISKNESTLDILCGKNPLWRYLCKEGYDVKGIDGAVGNFGQAKKRGEVDIGYGGFPIHLIRLPPIPYSDKSFDCVTLINAWRFLHSDYMVANVDFSVYDESDFYHCQKLYIAILKEACRVARKSVVIAERVYINPKGTWNCDFFETFMVIEDSGFFIEGANEFIFPEPFLSQVKNFSIVDKTEGEKRATYYGIGIVAYREGGK